MINRLQRKKYKITSYDNDRISCMGKIMLPIQLGTKTLEVMTYIIDKKLPYDILPGRPWIHPMRCIPYNLHRLLKFNHEGHEYVIEAVTKNPNMIG